MSWKFKNVYDFLIDRKYKKMSKMKNITMRFKTKTKTNIIPNKITLIISKIHWMRL